MIVVQLYFSILFIRLINIANIYLCTLPLWEILLYSFWLNGTRNCLKTFKSFHFADSVPAAKWCQRNECFSCSKHCFILFFNSFNFNFSCLLFLLKIWNYLFQKEVRRGFRILPLSNITYKQHKENISPCLLSLSLSPNTLPSWR